MNELPQDIKDFVDKEANVYARDHSSAPDKETPDWIISDFTSGATFMHNHLRSELDKKDKEIELMDAREVSFGQRIKYFEEEIERLKGLISEALIHGYHAAKGELEGIPSVGYGKIFREQNKI